jgi:hypothetical protein
MTERFGGEEAKRDILIVALKRLKVFSPHNYYHVISNEKCIPI